MQAAYAWLYHLRYSTLQGPEEGPESLQASSKPPIIMKMLRYCVYIPFHLGLCKLRPYMSLELLVLLTIVIDIYAVTL